MRGDVFALSVGLAVPLVLFLTMPHGPAMRRLWLPFATSAEPVRAPVQEAVCAFVTLTPQQEAAARTAARTAWQRDNRRSRQMRIDMFANTLPPLPSDPVLDFSARERYAEAERSEPYVAPTLLPTFAAPPPVPIAPPPDKVTVSPVFSREELLALPTTN